MIPRESHETALEIGGLILSDVHEGHQIMEKVNEWVDEIAISDNDHEMALRYLIEELKQLTKPEVVEKTRMNAKNLATIFAPNIMPCNSKNVQDHFNYTTNGVPFVSYLIENLISSNESGTSPAPKKEVIVTQL